MVDIAWQRAKWFFSWRLLLEYFFPVFKVYFRESWSYCRYPLSLRCFWNSSSRFWKFSFELFNLFWVIGGQLIENQPLLRQIYKEPPILSRDNLAKKKENVMSVTGHRSKVMKKQALCQNGKMHIATNSPYLGLQDKASSGPIKKNNKTKN